jgi:hypothetical protein
MAIYRFTVCKEEAPEILYTVHCEVGNNGRGVVSLCALWGCPEGNYVAVDVGGGHSTAIEENLRTFIVNSSLMIVEPTVNG